MSCEYLGDDASASDFGVGEPLRAAVVGEIQAGVIEAQLMQDRGVQVGDAHSLLYGLVAKLIGGPVNVAGLKAAPAFSRLNACRLWSRPSDPSVIGKRPNSPVH